MAAPTHVQDNWATFSAVSSGTVALSSAASGADVTAGNLLLALSTLHTTANRKVNSFADDNSNTWNIDEAGPEAIGHCSIGSTDNANGGATQITVTWSGAVDFTLTVAEVNGAATPDAYDSSDQYDDNTNDNTDRSANSLTTSSDVYVFAGGVNNSSHSGSSPPTGWTMIRDGSHNSRMYAVAYIESAGGLSADPVEFTHTGTARTWNGVAAAYVAGGGGGATVTLTTASETDAANSVSVVNPRTYTLSTASESETANAVTVQQAAAVSLGNATETDVANAVSVVNPRTYQLGNATDSSAANALSVVNPRSYTLGNASESDTANAVAITNASTVSLGTASESYVANSLTVSNPRTYTLTTASEVSIGRAVTVVNPRSYSIGNAAESNTANALTVSLPGQTTAGYILVRNATLKTGKATATLRTGRATATLIS